MDAITLLLNIGSSSVKYQLYQNESNICEGALSGLGTEHAAWEQTGSLMEPSTMLTARFDLDQALSCLFDHLKAQSQPHFILHRVVHGADQFVEPTFIDASVLSTLKTLIPLAPLHLPSNIHGIESASEAFPNARSIAVFDTAFHQSLPAIETTYALPYKLCQENGIRRFGFHGMSHGYAAEVAATHLGCENFSGVVLHLGSGASLCAIEKGKSRATSMGMTPLGGIAMGTRPGDMDPGVVLYLVEHLKKRPEQIAMLLNKESGLLGLCGASDMRDCLAMVEQSNPLAQNALATYVERIRDVLAAYLLKITEPQALIFTGGVGEHTACVREKVVAGMAHLGIEIDKAANNAAFDQPITPIHKKSSKVSILVIRADEEAYMMNVSQRLRKTN